MEYPIYRLILLFLVVSLYGADLDRVARQIYHNECGGRVKNLIHWNKGESFPSLGIGHFIWYPKGVKEPFVESFPKLIDYMDARGVKVPLWLHGFAPWQNETQMRSDPRIGLLRRFLERTMSIQADFLRFRLERSLLSLKPLKAPYRAISQVPNGLYILIDYLNFKGLGNNPKERYKGVGWGLIQVLACMQSPYLHPKAQFRACAKKVLKDRVLHAPSSKNEQRWLKGWYNRINTYR